MDEIKDEIRGCSTDLATMVVPPVGRLVATEDAWQPYRLLDPDGVAVEAVAAFLRDLQAAGRSPATLRSYGMDLLRWFRFLWAAGVAWERATRAEARDFCRWLQIAGKPARPHWRRQGETPTRSRAATPAPVAASNAYAASVRAHSETVLRCFYEFHRDAGSGPILNPFPLERSRRGRRAHAHHNPMEPHRNQRVGLYRPTVPHRIPRSIPDEQFNELFARLPSHRDRALVAFYVSTGARAAELLSATQGGVDPGRQLIMVVRKGTRQLQELPASTDAFVWLRLYQLELDGVIPTGRRQPLWWTLRRPHRPLTYHAVHRMFERVNQRVGTDVTLHSLRHTAAYRMAEDPALPLTDVQFVLGHAQLSTTQLYLTPRKEEVIRRLLAHHAEQTRQARQRVVPVLAPGYHPETLAVLLGLARGPVTRDRRADRRAPRSRPEQARDAGVAEVRPARTAPRGGVAGDLPGSPADLGATDPAAVRAGQPGQPGRAPARTRAAAGLAGGPAGPHLAGPLAGQRRRRRRQRVAAAARRLAARAWP